MAETTFYYNSGESEPLLSDKSSASDKRESKNDENKQIQPKTTLRHLLILPVFCLYTFGMVNSLMLIVEYTNLYCRKEEYRQSNLSLTNSSSPCDTNVSELVTETEARTSSKASEWNLYYSLAGGIPGVVANLLLGSYSDVLGRKFLIILTILGTCIRLTVTGIVIYFEAELIYLLIACFVEGCMGQPVTFVTASLAYAADLTIPGNQRITGILVLNVLLGIIGSCGVFASGYMAEGLGFETTMFINAGIMALSLFIATSFLPEALTKERRRKGKSVFQAFRVVFDFFIRNNENNDRWKYQIIVIIHALSNMSFASRVQTETLYQLATPFCWSPTKIGIYVSVRDSLSMLISICCLKLLQWRVDEVSLCILGNLAYTATYYWTAFIADNTSYYIVVVIGIFGPISIAMVKTIVSQLTPSDKQGAIFSTIGVFETVTSLVASVSTSAIYAETVTIMRGLVFLVLGSYNAIALILSIVLKIGWHIERRTKQLPNG